MLGDTMTVSIHLRNPGAETEMHFTWVLELPEYNWSKPIKVLPDLPLPEGYDQTFNIDIPVGYWGGTAFQAIWAVALLDPVTSEVISYDDACWKYQPMGGAAEIQEDFAAQVAEVARKAASGILHEED